MKKLGFGMSAFVFLLAFFCAPAPTSAKEAASPAGGSAASFYKGKTVEFVVPYPPGGANDTAARLLSIYLKKHLGATVIVKNEPGAGGKLAMNRLARESNGLSLVTLIPRALAMAQVFGETGARYDLNAFNWLATISKDQYPIVVGKKSVYRTMAEIQNAKEVKFGANTRASGAASRPLVMGHVLGINVKVIAGYSGAAEVMLALQRGEVDGSSISIQSLYPHIQSQDLFPVVVMGHERIKRIPHVPTIYEVKKLSPQEKRIADISIALDSTGRPVATTPGVPKERVAFLEAAVKKSLEEPELVKRFERLGDTIDYSPGKETAEAVNMILSMKGEEKKLIGKLLGVEGY